jgi:hypothetical protein
MKYRNAVVRFVFFVAALASSQTILAQSVPTATQQLQLSVFAAGTGTYTDLEGGRNAGITAGGDITYLGFRHFRPAFELRGTYPIDGGQVDSQKNFLLGPKVEYPLGRFHPYADFFVGRGGINYQNGGYFPPVGPGYLSSNTFVYSPGVGVDYSLTHHLAVKADVQFQHWNVPFPPGTIHPTALSLGVVYNFDLNRHHHHHHHHAR